MTLATDQVSGARTLSGMSAALDGIRELVLEHWAKLVRRNVHGAQALPTPILINTLPP